MSNDQNTLALAILGKLDEILEALSGFGTNLNKIEPIMPPETSTQLDYEIASSGEAKALP